jgi:hypothetical protein
VRLSSQTTEYFCIDTHSIINSIVHSNSYAHARTQTQIHKYRRKGYLHDVIGDFGGEHSGEVVRHPNHRQRTWIRHIRIIPTAYKTHSQVCSISSPRSHLSREQLNAFMFWMHQGHYFASNSIESTILPYKQHITLFLQCG